MGVLLWLAFAPASQAQLNVSVTAFGALADGVLRTDGAMNVGSSVLTSASASFTGADAGKYIQVIGAGPGGSSHADGMMVEGSAVLTSPSGSFNSADVGRGIIVLGAGAAGGNLITTIAGYTSNTSVTLNAPAMTATSGVPYYYGAMTLEGTITSVLSPTSVQLSAVAAATITSATYAYGTDNHAAFQTALDTVGEAGGGTVTVPEAASCPSGAVCGYVATTTDQMTAVQPGAIKIRFNNVSLIGSGPQTNVFCRGAWAAYYNSVKYPGQTGTIRGFCVAVGDDGGPLGAAGEAINNVTVSNLHLYGMTNGNTYSYSFSPTDPPLTTTGDGWDETHKAVYIWENAPHSNIVVDTVSIQDFKGENIYSGGGAMTGIIIRNCTMTNFNGDGISMLAADLQVLNNTISNGSNAGIEDSTVSSTSAALIRQLYQGNTISDFPREGLVVVGVDSGITTGAIQILNNYFDTIAQTNASGAESAIYLGAQCCGVDVPPSNVTISGNTCHDCFAFGNIETAGTTVVSNNTIIVDQMNGDAFLYFTYPMTNFTISNNIGYRTAAGAAAGRGLNSVYNLNPGYQTGDFAWNNVLVQNDSWNLPGTPNYTFVINSGPGWGLVIARNVIWQGETCTGCTYPDTNHGVVNLAATTTIEPYGPVVYVTGNASAVTATLDASKELDGSQVRIVNSGTAPVTFHTDQNLTLSSPVTLNPGGGSVTFYYSGATGTYSTGSANSTVSVTVTPPAASLGAGQTAQFSATVGGTSNQQVTWGISPTGAGGISSSGLYTAPASISSLQTVTVQATSVANSTAVGTATVTLTPVAVTVTPPTGSLTANLTLQLSATVTGSSNTAVTWSILNSGPGTVSASGLYTAPASIAAQQTVTVQATSAADATKTATATITLIPTVAIAVTPPTGSLTANLTLQLTATVTGSSNTAVTWSILNSGPGTVSASGLYTAPASIAAQQTVTVQATSAADSTKTATATITLYPAVAIAVTPPTGSLTANLTLQLSATVTGSGNTAVTWSILNSGPGTVSASGLYTAPALIAAQQMVTVQATSAADATKTATATITLYPTTSGGTGSIYVGDFGNGRVEQFSGSGSLAQLFGTGGGPYALALDASNNIWIADRMNNRVEALSPTGALLLQFGQQGGNNGQFSNPTGIAIDPKGNVWVLDSSNARVQEFNDSGSYMGQFGSYGNGAGQFSQPEAIAFDGSGNLWVADSGNNRVQEFGSNGALLQAFSVGGAAYGITFDPSGNLYIADRGHNRVAKFTADGAPLLQFGSQGGGNGQFSNPSGVAADSSGNVWVVDTSNGRVEEFSGSGVYLGQFGTCGRDNGQLSEPEAIAINTGGQTPTVAITVTPPTGSLTANLTLQLTATVTGSSNTAVTWSILNSGPGSVSASGLYTAPASIAAQQTVTVQATSAADATKTATAIITLNPTAAGPSSVFVGDFGNNRIEQFSGNGTFTQALNVGEGPYAIAFDSGGNIWMVDRTKDRVQEFSAAGALVLQFGQSGRGNGQFSNPSGILIDSSGSVWVLDTSNARVQEFNQSGAYMGQFGSYGSGNGQFSQPAAIALDASGNIWVADGGNSRVEEFSGNGSFIKAFAVGGSPYALTFDPSGDLYVLDRTYNRITKLSSSGAVLLQFGSQGGGNGQLNNPSGIAADASGDLWVVDTSNARIEEFSSAGVYLSQFGSYGSGNGQFVQPQSIAIYPSNL